MAHWRTMRDDRYLFASDLQGRDVVVTIAKVAPEKLVGEGGRESRLPVAYFQGKEKGLALNATNCRTIGNLLGTNDVKDWIGKSITLYPTTTKVGRETTECIRIRPELPRASAPAKEGGADGAR